MLIKVCPRCGSDKVEWVIPQNWSMWSCYECNYTGMIVEVNRKNQVKLRKKWLKKNGVDIEGMEDDDLF